MSLTYEDCKELKDAGFPQVIKTDGFFYDKEGRMWCHRFETYERMDNLCILAPTLSELLEACGEEFLSLRKIGNYFEATGKGEIFGGGSSPEQAVKNLWMAINKK